MNVWLAILWKDLTIELRSRERVLAMAIFSLLVVVVFHFSLPGGATAASRDMAPGLLWIAYIFSALLGLGRSFSLELENDALSGIALAPAERGFVFLGKATANWVILGAVQSFTALVFALVFRLELGAVAGRLALVIGLGSLGLCSVGTLAAAVASRTRLREVMLPVLMLPVLWPVLRGAVGATTMLLDTGELPFEPIQFRIVTDGIYLILSFLVFEYVLDE